jgi:hypothetical protein
MSILVERDLGDSVRKISQLFSKRASYKYFSINKFNEEKGMPVRGEFQAQGDDGKTYDILVRVGEIELNNSEEHETIPRAPELFTSSGLLVKSTDDGKYKVIDTGVILTADE